MSSLFILQNQIMEYRKPLFNMLADRYDVVVVHAGKHSVGKTDRYRELIVPARRIGPFFIQNWLPTAEMRRDAKAIVAMFDLRWPSYILSSLLPGTTRRILWGHWYSQRLLVDQAKDFFLKMADAIILYGDEEVELIVARGIERQRIFIAANTVHVPAHRDLSDRPKSSLIFVGRLIPRKRVDLLIEAFAEVSSRLPLGTVLDIVGDGDLREDAEILSQRLGVGSLVHFHGEINDPAELQELFSHAYAYVSPEHIGLGGLHSFGHGVAVITRAPEPYKRSALRYGPEFLNLLDGENAIIYKRECELQHAILRICCEDGLARRLGRNAYRLYSTKRTMEGMVDAFCRAIEGT
jgi:glycosyltransferase involved in cell wall biosynthesis